MKEAKFFDPSDFDPDKKYTAYLQAKLKFTLFVWLNFKTMRWNSMIKVERIGGMETGLHFSRDFETKEQALYHGRVLLSDVACEWEERIL